MLNYVSAYSTMHPWEDFAETFAVYLDMVSALDTAAHGKLIPEPDLTNLEGMIDAYQQLGIALNELNRNNGLHDFLPEVIAPPIRKKLHFIHDAWPSRANRSARLPGSWPIRKTWPGDADAGYIAQQLRSVSRPRTAR